MPKPKIGKSSGKAKTASNQPRMPQDRRGASGWATSPGDGQLVLAFPGQAQPMGLVLSQNLPYRTWAPVGHQLRRAKDWVNFAIGDWLCHGEVAYGEKYAQAASETGIPEETLMILKHVSEAVAMDIRRIDKLSWSHHRLVAPAKYDREAKIMWLERAIENEWGVRAMAEAMNPKVSKEEEADENSTVSGCETCGNTPAGMKCCGKCASVASAALNTVGIEGAIELMKRRPSKPQAEMLSWAFEHIKEPKFPTDAAEIEWQGRYGALKKTVEKLAKKAA